MTELGWTYDPGSALRSWQNLVGATAWWPDTTLSVEGDYGRIDLRVDMITKDSHHPETTVRITAMRMLGHEEAHPMPPDAMERLLRGRLREVACHEADEWIVIAGRRPFNPHKEVPGTTSATRN